MKYLLLTLAVVLAAPVASSAAERGNRPPNIVFILADDLGYAELGCYGQEKIRTPHIDALAAGGIRFTQCYSGSNVCAPSRSVLMTGLHTGHTPIRANGGGMALAPGDVTVAEVLGQAGYTCGGFGKWGLGVENSTGSPVRQGFDLFFGYLHQVHAHFFYPYYLWKNETRFLLPENEGRQRARYSHDEIHREALDFIRRNHQRPFFCYVPYTIPHVELVVPEDSLAPYRGKFPEEPLPDPRPGYIHADEPLATFAGMVSRMDRDVGQLVALLEELGVDDNTVIFFSSDNGAQGGAWQRVTDFFQGTGPLRDYKGSFYEGGIRVPLIARWPGRIGPGQVSDHVCAFWDVMPTLAELAGVAPPSNTDGISLTPTLLGRADEQPRHEFLYWEYPRGREVAQAVRVGDWKLVRHRPNAAWELYNLADDIGETTDLAKLHADVVERLTEIANEQHTPPRQFPGDDRRPTPDDYVR